MSEIATVKNKIHELEGKVDALDSRLQLSDEVQRLRKKATEEKASGEEALHVRLELLEMARRQSETESKLATVQAALSSAERSANGWHSAQERLTQRCDLLRQSGERQSSTLAQSLSALNDTLRSEVAKLKEQNRAHATARAAAVVKIQEMETQTAALKLELAAVKANAERGEGEVQTLLQRQAAELTELKRTAQQTATALHAQHTSIEALQQSSKSQSEELRQALEAIQLLRSAAAENEAREAENERERSALVEEVRLLKRRLAEALRFLNSQAMEPPQPLQLPTSPLRALPVEHETPLRMRTPARTSAAAVRSRPVSAARAGGLSGRFASSDRGFATAPVTPARAQGAVFERSYV